MYVNNVQHLSGEIGYKTSAVRSKDLTAALIQSTATPILLYPTFTLIKNNNILIMRDTTKYKISEEEVQTKPKTHSIRQGFKNIATIQILISETLPLVEVKIMTSQFARENTPQYV